MYVCHLFILKNLQIGKQIMRLITVVLLALIFSAGSFPDAGDSIVGEWISFNSDGDKGIVKIYKAKNHKYYGQLIKAFDDNLDHKLRTQNEPLFILKEFEYKSNNEWSEGVVIRPKFGDRYRGRLKLKDRNTLEVTGYLSIFSKSRIAVISI